MRYRIHNLKLMIIHAQLAVATARKKQPFSKELHRLSLLRYVIESVGTLSQVQKCIEKKQNKPRPWSLEISANDSRGQLVTRPALTLMPFGVAMMPVGP